MRISLDSADSGDSLDVAATCIDTPEAFDAWVRRALTAAGVLWPGKVIAMSVSLAVADSDPSDGVADSDPSDGVGGSGSAAPDTVETASDFGLAPDRPSPREGTKLSYVVEAVLEGKSLLEIAENLGDGVDVDRIRAMISVARTKGYLPARGQL